MTRNPLPRPITGQEALLFDIATSLRSLCDHFAGAPEEPNLDLRAHGSVEIKEPAGAPKPKKPKNTRKPPAK